MKPTSKCSKCTNLMTIKKYGEHKTPHIHMCTKGHDTDLPYYVEDCSHFRDELETRAEKNFLMATNKKLTSILLDLMKKHPAIYKELVIK